jgi:hypothetical protein
MDIARLKQIAQEFNTAVNQYQLCFPEAFTFEDLMNTDNVVTNRSGNNKLTCLFLNNFFPQNDQPEYHHFTTIETLKSIVKSQSIWLTTVAKRFGEKEFKPFYAAHGMDGYEKGKNHLGEPLERELVENAFYISLTHQSLAKENAEHLWIAFSKNNGVKLVFEMQHVNSHLRRVYYASNSKMPVIPLLNDFINIVKRLNRYLIIDGIATIGFFYLPGILACEEEYRLLLKREKAERCNLQFGNLPTGHEYVELPLFGNAIAEIKLTKVFVDKKDEDLVRDVLNSNPLFSTVAVEYI